MNIIMNREIRSLINQGRSIGWVVKQTHNGHYMWKHPQGGMFVSAGTPSDKRAIQNIRSFIRKTSGVRR